MKKVLLFGVSLLCSVLCRAYSIQGFECFFHDSGPVVPATGNRCFVHLNHLFTHPLFPCFGLLNSTYRWYGSPLVPSGPGGYWSLTSPGAVLVGLTVRQQATLAIKRFCIGITNRNAVPRFVDLGALLDAMRGLGGDEVLGALASGGYDTPVARFLYQLFRPGGISPAIMGRVGNRATALAVVLKLQRRVEKNLKEIHWSSSSLVAVRDGLWHNILGHLGMGVGAILPPVYLSIKSRINGPFTVWGLPPPHSATFVLYDETSVN